MVKRSKSQDELEENDDDLKDLLSNDKMMSRKSNGTETEHLNLDHLVQGKLNLMTSPSQESNKSSSSSSSPSNINKHGNNNAARAYSNNNNNKGGFAVVRLLPLQFLWQICRTIFSYIAMLCHFYPGICSVILFCIVGMTLYGMALAVFNPHHEYGMMHHDHSDIKSVYDLSVGKIDHWCLRGDNDSCNCEDPLTPTSLAANHKSWQLAFKTNHKIVKALIDNQTSVDVAFLGESIVEEMDGRWLG